MPDDEPEINAVAVNLSDITDDEAEEEAEEKEDSKGGGGLDDLMNDIFAEEHEEDDRLKAFGDLEHLTMLEVSSEIEAVLEELRLRQEGHG